jgi:hypothetical protein
MRLCRIWEILALTSSWERRSIAVVAAMLAGCDVGVKGMSLVVGRVGRGDVKQQSIGKNVDAVGDAEPLSSTTMGEWWVTVAIADSRGQSESVRR